MDWSADKYGLIGIAFALQSCLLVAAFVVVIGAVVGATVVDRVGAVTLRGRASEPADDDVTRRTRLAAERTWLAWWRSGIAAATAAVGVGGVVPSLVDGSRTPYVVLGAGYALLAAVIFVGGGPAPAAGRRARSTPVATRTWGEWGVLGLTLAATALALGTLAIIVVQP